MKKRLDLLLVEKGLASSRTKAQDLIKLGQVFILKDGSRRPANNSSQLMEPETIFEVQSSEWQRFASRGGLKLEGALDRLQISVKGLQVLDVGISTGGFTDCLLQRGAQQVVGVDVGHGQLDAKLKNHPQLLHFEGVNARELHLNSLIQAQMPEKGWPFIVIDVSFISLTLILPSVVKVLKNQGQILALVKPQFEVGPEGLGRGGLVRDPSLYSGVEKKIREKCLELNLTVRDYLNSSIEGKDGNREFFIYVQKKDSSI
jgi:23S rRNA (cytidine1920-2'-O)/16S rRNA (cytidine1409-2'-O)-methyltransferase